MSPAEGDEWDKHILFWFVTHIEIEELLAMVIKHFQASDHFA